MRKGRHLGPSTDALLFTLLQQQLKPASLAEVLITINGSQQLVLRQRSSWLLLAKNLDPTSTHHFKVELRGPSTGNVLRFLGLILDTGGLLIKQQHSGHTSNEHQSNSSEVGGNAMIEIFGPSNFLSNGTSLRSKPISKPWPIILEEAFQNTMVSTVKMPELTSISSNTVESKDLRLLSEDVANRMFFRAGPPGTDLYQQFWPFEQLKVAPIALVLILGLADVQAFLRESSLTEHKVTQFVNRFAREYSKFIQSIRRTALSPANIASIKDPSAAGGQNDESFLYNSAPSTLPIFLMLQPLPSSLRTPKSRQLTKLLHHATVKIIDELKWHIGDKYTTVVDSAGWLDDNDFEEGDDPDNGGFELTQDGHMKVAYHMLFHLCPYLDYPGCAFNEREEFVGNMYDPATENIGKLMEETKIAKIKELFNVQ